MIKLWYNTSNLLCDRARSSGLSISINIRSILLSEGLKYNNEQQSGVIDRLLMKYAVSLLGIGELRCFGLCGG